MEDLFKTLDFPVAMLVVLLSAFGIILRKLWQFFTERVNKLEKKVDDMSDAYKVLIENSTKAIGDNTAMLQMFVNTLIDSGLSAGGTPNSQKQKFNSLTTQK